MIKLSIENCKKCKYFQDPDLCTCNKGYPDTYDSLRGTRYCKSYEEDVVYRIKPVLSIDNTLESK